MVISHRIKKYRTIPIATCMLAVLGMFASSSVDAKAYIIENCSDSPVYVCSYRERNDAMKIAHTIRSLKAGEESKFRCDGRHGCKAFIAVTEDHIKNSKAVALGIVGVGAAVMGAKIATMEAEELMIELPWGVVIYGAILGIWETLHAVAKNHHCGELRRSDPPPTEVHSTKGESYIFDLVAVGTVDDSDGNPQPSWHRPSKKARAAPPMRDEPSSFTSCSRSKPLGVDAACETMRQRSGRSSPAEDFSPVRSTRFELWRLAVARSSPRTRAPTLAATTACGSSARRKSAVPQRPSLTRLTPSGRLLGHSRRTTTPIAHRSVRLQPAD